MKLKWDEIGERYYETGLSQGVLYLRVDETGTYPEGVSWNGLISVNESPSGAEPTPFYADNIKYLNLMSDEEFNGTIECYTYPDEFAECDGSKEVVPGVMVNQQTRKTFGLVYKTSLGSDTAGTARGYKLHLIYGALASPSDKGYETIGDSPEAITFSYEISTTPVFVAGMDKPTASLTIDSTKVEALALAAFEDQLFGKDAKEESSEGAGDAEEAITANLPLPDEVISFFDDLGGGQG